MNGQRPNASLCPGEVCGMGACEVTVALPLLHTAPIDVGERDSDKGEP